MTNSSNLPDGNVDSLAPRNLPPLRRFEMLPPEQQDQKESLSDQIAKYHNSLKELGPLEIEDYPSLEELTEEVYSHLVQKSLSQENSTRTPSIQASLLRAMLDL
jgi:hypothetical protein